MFIESNETGLTPLLTKASHVFGRHLSFGASYTVPIATGALVYEEAPGHVNPNDGLFCTIRGSQLKSLDSWKQWRLDDVVAEFVHKPLSKVQSLSRNSEDFARLVFNA